MKSKKALAIDTTAVEGGASKGGKSMKAMKSQPSGVFADDGTFQLDPVSSPSENEMAW